jgi:Ca2+-binding EF-hand superfamily protein
MISSASFFGALALAAVFSLAAEPTAVQKGKFAKPKPKSSAPHNSGPIGAPGSEPVDPAPEVRSPEQYFDVCDYNADGVLSFTEAHSSLGVDQDGFRVYDVDRDGLISLAEFKARYNTILDNGGAFPPPIPKAKGRKPARRTPEELLAQYDKNDDRALDAREIQAALEEYQVRDLDPEVALEKLDTDNSKKLELAELEELSNILSPKLDAKRGKKAKSIEELFGKKLPREMRPDSTPIPPRIAGPISPFRRLDLDGNGTISREDLYELQRPLQLSVRINAVFATLDVDNDGVVSENEFWSSMSSPISSKR